MSASVSQGGRQSGVSYSNQSRPPFPDGKMCGKKHTIVCSHRIITCFKYGQTGHYSNVCPKGNPNSYFQCGRLGHLRKDCPMNRPAALGASKAASNRTPTARTFNMTVQDAVRNTDVLAGTLLLNSVNANVLFYYGATKSFISRDFAYKLNLRTSR